jgi:hypothetical protein
MNNEALFVAELARVPANADNALNSGEFSYHDSRPDASKMDASRHVVCCVFVRSSHALRS